VADANVPEPGPAFAGTPGWTRSPADFSYEPKPRRALVAMADAPASSHRVHGAPASEAPTPRIRPPPILGVGRLRQCARSSCSDPIAHHGCTPAPGLVAEVAGERVHGSQRTPGRARHVRLHHFTSAELLFHSGACTLDALLARRATSWRSPATSDAERALEDEVELVESWMCRPGRYSRGEPVDAQVPESIPTCGRQNARPEPGLVRVRDDWPDPPAVRVRRGARSSRRRLASHRQGAGGA